MPEKFENKKESMCSVSGPYWGRMKAGNVQKRSVKTAEAEKRVGTAYAPFHDSSASTFHFGRAGRFWQTFMRVALRGFWDVRGFPFCGGRKVLKLPLAVGKRESQTLFHPRIPLAKIPLEQCIRLDDKALRSSKVFFVGGRFLGARLRGRTATHSVLRLGF